MLKEWCAMDPGLVDCDGRARWNAHGRGRGDGHADTFIRVFMTICEADVNTVVQAQTFAPLPARTGFTAVEWGGAQRHKIS